MITLAPGLRVYLACGVTDMRNYADRRVAHSVDRDRPFRPIVITESGDRDHALAGA